MAELVRLEKLAVAADQMRVYIDQSIAEDVKVINDVKVSNDVKVINGMNKVLLDLTKVNTQRRDFMEELEKLKCSMDAVRSVLFLNVDVGFDGAFGGVGDEEVVVGEGLEEEALVEFMEELCEEDEDGRKNEKDGLFNLKANDQSRKA
ncbi:hypothetical protein Tco_1394341 [Tanacetum coccineum]